MSKQNYLRLYDTCQFSFLSPDLVKIKDDYEGAFKQLDPNQQTHHTGMGTIGQDPIATNDQSQISNGLIANIAATHAGIITRNNGFYLPDRMKKGAETFTKDFGKPILVHHAEDQTAIGRVVAADYVDTSNAIADQYNGLVVKTKTGKEVGTISDQLIKDFVNDKMPFSQKIDVVRSLLMDSVLEDQGYEGLGHIMISANIVDPDAIQKLIDGRFLTGSVGATTDAAVCSVCRSDWTESGKCEHKPGAIYDGAKCFIIAGQLVYDEFSFVNKPADRHAKVLELHYNGIQDSVEIDDATNNKIYEVMLEFPQYGSKKEDNMGDPKNKKDSVADNDDTQDVDVQDHQDDESSQDASTEDNATNVSDDQDSEGTTDVTDNTVDNTDADEDNTDEGESVEDFVNRVIDAEQDMSAEDEDRFIDLLYDEVKSACSDGELQLTDAVLADAKLSTEDYKKMSKSAFCGPNRSFPVTDCTHVIACRRLLDRANVNEVGKAKILDNVNRKAKVLDCSNSVNQKDSVENTTDETVQDDTAARVMHMILATLEENSYSMSDDEALSDDDKGMLRTILKRLAGIVGKDAFVQTAIDEELVENSSVLLDEVVKHEETIVDLKDRLAATQKEYHMLFQDVENLQDALIEEKSNTRKEMEKGLSILMTLNDKKVEDRDFTELSDTQVVSEIVKLTDSIDLQQITDKLDDGMARNPSETVDNPIESTQDNLQKSTLTVEDANKIEETYMTLLFSRGQIVADQWRDEMLRSYQMTSKKSSDK